MTDTVTDITPQPVPLRLVRVTFLFPNPYDVSKDAVWEFVGKNVYIYNFFPSPIFFWEKRWQLSLMEMFNRQIKHWWLHDWYVHYFQHGYCQQKKKNIPLKISSLARQHVTMCIWMDGQTKLYICDTVQHHLNMHTTMIHIQQHQNVHRNTIQSDKK